MLVIIYVLIQGIGLWIAAGGLWIEEGIVEQIKENPEQGVVKNPSSLASTGQIFAYILAATGFLLLGIRYNLKKLITIFINLGLLTGLTITLGSLLGYPGIAIALLVFIARLWKKEDAYVMNLVLVLSLPGIGTWLGASLESIPAFLFLVLLTLYDISAVFWTKHMVTLADNASDTMPLMFAIPMDAKAEKSVRSKEKPLRTKQSKDTEEGRSLGLGTGDMVMPLVFTTALLRNHPLGTAIITSLGGLFGLIALFIYITQKKGVVLPALPPITIGLLIGYLIGLMII